MAITLRNYNFHHVIPLTITIFFLLHHSVVVIAQDEIPSDPSSINQWLHTNFNSYSETTSEIAKPDDTNLNPDLLAAMKNTTFVTVQQDGKGDFANMKAAIESIPKGNKNRIVIKIGPGTYKEKVVITKDKPYITFLGNPNAMPTLTYGDSAQGSDTLKSGSVMVFSDYFIASNIIFENSSPAPIRSKDTIQAVAMRIVGDRAAFYNCKFYGYQDTLLDDAGMHFFKDCLMRGTIDFIFGDGKSIYLNCKVESIAEGSTWLTAHARKTESDPGGFSFVHSDFSGTGEAYICRAWKPYSRVVVAYSSLGTLINPKGWSDHDYPDYQKSVYYGEYENKGPGAATDQRVGWSKKLTSEEAKPFISMSFINAKEWLLLPPK